MSKSDDFSFTIDFSKLATESLQQLCQLDESITPTPELWVSMTSQLLNELYEHLKPAHVTQLAVNKNLEYVVTVFVPFADAAEAQRLLARYLRTRKLTL